LASHTFSHYYCNEVGQTATQFREDLKAAQQAAIAKQKYAQQAAIAKQKSAQAAMAKQKSAQAAMMKRAKSMRMPLRRR
jgi:hypothetical protein